MTEYTQKLRALFLPLSTPERFLTGAWLVIMALMPFHAFLSTWIGSAAGSLLVWKSWKELLLIAALFLSLYVLQQRGELRSFCRDTLVQCIAAYTALHLVLWAIFQPPAQAAIAALLMNLRFLGIFLLAMVIARFVNKKELLWLVTRLLLVAAGLVAVFGILQLTVLPNDFLRHFGYGAQTIAPTTTLDNNDAIIRVMSTLRGPNPFGEYLILILLLLISVYNRKKWMWGSLAIAAVLWLEYHTYSRSAWLGMFVALAVFAWLSIKDSQLRQKVLLGAGVAAVVISTGIALALPHSTALQSVILHNQHSDTDAGSTVAHAEAGTASLERIAAQPFGQGPGSAGPASFYGPSPQIPENYYLQIAEEVGLVGLAVFLAICVLVVKRLWPMRHEWWPRILLAWFASIAVINLFLHGWADDTSAILWWGLAGLFMTSGAPFVQQKKTKITQKA